MHKKDNVIQIRANLASKQSNKQTQGKKITRFYTEKKTNIL